MCDIESVKSEKKEKNKKRKAVRIEDSCTKPRKRRVSTTPNSSGSGSASTSASATKKKKRKHVGRRNNNSDPSTTAQDGIEFSVVTVTPCKAKTRNTPEATETPTFMPSPGVSCSTSTSSGSSNSDLSQLLLPPNVANIDEYTFELPQNNPYLDHNSATVMNKTFMRDYGKDHFHLLIKREKNEFLKQGGASKRVTRSKRQILSSNGSSSSASVNAKSSAAPTAQGSNRPFVSQASTDNKPKYHPADNIVLMDPEFDYMANNQPYLSSPMRCLLLDWFVELSEEYKLKPETLHLAVKILDRVMTMSERRTNKERAAYMKYKDTKTKSKQLTDVSIDSDGENVDDDSETRKSKEEGKIPPYTHKGFVIKRHMLQCVGCACMLLATKFEEIKPPSSNDFAYISDATYTPRQIARMEMKICTHLKFNIRGVTPMMFFHRFIRASQEGDSKPQNELLEKVCLYILELSFLEYQFVGVKSSLLMASTLYLARATLGIRSLGFWKRGKEGYPPKRVGQFWSPTLEFYTGYDIWALEYTVKLLHKLQYSVGARKDELNSAFNKYKSSKFLRASLKTAVNYEDLGF